MKFSTNIFTGKRGVPYLGHETEEEEYLLGDQLKIFFKNTRFFTLMQVQGRNSLVKVASNVRLENRYSIFFENKDDRRKLTIRTTEGPINLWTQQNDVFDVLFVDGALRIRQGEIASGKTKWKRSFFFFQQK